MTANSNGVIMNCRMKKLLPILLVFIGLFAFLSVPTLALSRNPDFSKQAQLFISKNCDKVSGNLATDALCFLLVGSQNNETAINDLDKKIENIAHSKNKSLYVYDGNGVMLGPLVKYDVENLGISVYSTLLNLVVNINPETGTLVSKTGWIYYPKLECAGTPYVSVEYSNELFIGDQGMLYSPSPSNDDFESQILYKSSRSSLVSGCESVDPVEIENEGGIQMNNLIPLRFITGDGEKLKAFENLALPLSIKFE